MICRIRPPWNRIITARVCADADTTFGLACAMRATRLRGGSVGVAIALCLLRLRQVPLVGAAVFRATDADLREAALAWCTDTNAATSVYGEINTWDVSEVKTTGYLFYTPGFRHCARFNDDVDAWQVGAVTNVTSMFQGAAVFNQNIDSWRVASVTDMSTMFANAHQFNQPLNSWQTSSVTDMSDMFNNAEKFNQNINSWQTGAAKTFN